MILVLFYSSLLLTFHIIHVSDIHGWLMDLENQRNSVAHLKYYVDKLRRSNDVIFVNSGDDCDGTGFSDAASPACKNVWDVLK